MKATRENYENFLIWLITPQSNDEKERFKTLIDDYCRLSNNINYLTDDELINEVNNQLKHLNLQIDIT